MMCAGGSYIGRELEEDCMRCGLEPEIQINDFEFKIDSSLSCLLCADTTILHSLSYLSLLRLNNL